MEVLDRIEQQRAELEANFVKLQKALSHWRNLELDYEGLKDEINELPQDATKSDYQQIARDFGPQKLDDKELDELFEPQKGKVRQPKQLVDVLSKRLDYVRRNVSTLESQIEGLEKRKEQMLVSESDPDDGELPVTEIIEELDKDGNVISSKIQPQGDSASKVIDILKQVEGEAEKKPSTSSTPNGKAMSKQVKDNFEDSKSPTADAQKATYEKIDPQESSNEDESDIVSINRDDTEEEAQMRREMLQYGLEEVGNIVAELELEGEDFTLAGSEDIDDLSDGVEEHSDISDLDGSSEDEDDDEDGSGRARQAAHSAAYRKRMEDLQKRLGLSMENVGPSPASTGVSEHIEFPSADVAKQYIEQLPPDIRKRVERPSAKEAARTAAIAREEASKATITDVKDKKRSRAGKKVSFATELDIASENPKKQDTTTAITSETIVERDSSVAAPSTDVKKSTRVSRFKSSRNNQPSTPSILKTTSPPTEGSDVIAEAQRPVRTHSDVLVERPASKKTPVAPEADDFDEELQQRQIAMEHHNLKNRLVHNQGGYVQGGELDNWGDEVVAPEVMDERTGQPKKISRFKAARVKG